MKLHYKNIFLFLSILAVNGLLFYMLSHSSVRTRPFGDGDFHEETKVLTQYLWGNVEYNSVSVTKAPGPVLYYFTPYLLSGSHPEENTYWIFSMIWNAIWSSVALYLLSVAATRFSANTLAGIFPVVLSFAVPLHVYYGTSVTGEVPAFIGICLIIYAYSYLNNLSAKKAGRQAIIFFATGLSLLALSRPNTSLIFGLMIPVLYFLWKQKSPMFKPLSYGLAIALGTIFLISTLVKQLPNTRKSYKQLDYLSYVILQGCFQFRDEPNDWRFFDPSIRGDSKDMINYQATQKKLYQQMEAENKSLSEVNLTYMKDDILSHPFTFLRQCITKTLYGHSLNVSSVKPQNFNLGPFRGTTGYLIFYYSLNAFNLMLILLTLTTLFRKYRWNMLLLVLIPWLALLLFHATTYMEYRYLFPIRAVIVSFSAIGIVNILNKYFPSFIQKFNINSIPNA